ncbi:MAG TPA: flagellar biosynthesis anti-sigma factor FlgM [Terriglobales bacterium]|nr:flagellar biosynthesis anti-sigma factor FlgM [Terriglobales bacterium]
MRIDLGSSSFLPTEGPGAARKGTLSERPNGASAPESDSAKLWSGPSSIAALTAAASQVPEVRQDKVAALADLVQSGSYKVSASQTAEEMVAQMRAA